MTSSKINCFICPNGCEMMVDKDGDEIKVTGNKCSRGEEFARQEVTKPLRILTSSVVARGLSQKMISVRTSKPIPKRLIPAAMLRIKEIVVDQPVEPGDVLVNNFINLPEVDLIATRRVNR